MQTKQCCKCNIEKVISEYHKDTHTKDDTSPRCKECQSERSKRYQSRNKESVKRQRRQYYLDNKERFNKKNKENYWKNREQRLQESKNRRLDPRVAKDDKLWNGYRIRIEEYEQMLQEQNNKCAVCEREVKLEVDHCHSTGRVRSLLCGGCNRGLGQFNDDYERVRKAAEYLERNAPSFSQ